MKKILIPLTLLFLLPFFKTTEIVNASETIGYDESSVLGDLQTDTNFDFTKYKLDSSVPDVDSIKSLSLVEDNCTSLYLYLFNQNGKSLTNEVKNTRITMSVSDNDSLDFKNVYYYSLDLIDVSQDNLFYKFKIDYKFPSSVNTERFYYISEIEFDFGKGYSEGRHNTIGQAYSFKGFGSSLEYHAFEITVVNLSITPGSYRFDVLNGNSVPKAPHFYDLFYITFPIDKSYGDLIGLMMCWKEDVTDIYYNVNKYSGKQTIYRDNSKLSDLIIIDYRYDDLFDVKSLSSDSGNGINTFFTKLFHWGYENDKDYNDIPRLEKITYDKAQFSTFDNYYFSDDTKKNLNEQYLNNIGGSKEQYVVRFALKDFCNSVDPIKDALSGIHTSDDVTNIKTEIVDCDVLTLTYSKDGKEYTLLASSKPASYDPGNKVPEPSRANDLWDKFKRILSIICLIVLLIVCAPLLINVVIPLLLLIWKVISYPFKLIKRKLSNRK